MTNLKGVSSMKLQRDLGVALSNTWHMLYCIREGLLPEILQVFEDPVEVDESSSAAWKRTSMRANCKTHFAATGEPANSGHKWV